jgi:tetratricopeptide (TPR) repeat protein
LKKIRSFNISFRQLRLNNILKLSYNKQGVKKSDEGKFKEALEYFTKAIELDPKDSLSYFNRATIQMQTGNIPAARSDFKLSASCGELVLS